MNKAYFLRNPNDISELIEAAKNGEALYYTIEKVVELNGDAYKEFTHHISPEHDFIVKNAGRMYLDADKVLHCILVTISGATDGILVHGKGQILYAAYWSYLRSVYSEDNQARLNRSIENAEAGNVTAHDLIED